MPKLANANISESVEFLLDQMKSEQDQGKYDKLKMLYLLKTNEGIPLRHIAESLGKHRATIQKWDKTYKEQGFNGLLEEKNTCCNNIPQYAIDYW